MGSRWIWQDVLVRCVLLLGMKVILKVDINFWYGSLILATVWMCFFFFFSSRRRHTRFDCDWSSDVCSSDLEMGEQTDRLVRVMRQLDADLSEQPASPLVYLEYAAGLEPEWFVEVAERLRRSEEHTSELQSQSNLVCRLLLEKKKPSFVYCDT